MSSVAEFLEMGGYAAFVWPAFGATALVMVATLIASLRMLRRNEAALEALKAQTKEGSDEAEA